MIALYLWLAYFFVGFFVARAAIRREFKNNTDGADDSDYNLAVFYAAIWPITVLVLAVVFFVDMLKSQGNPVTRLGKLIAGKKL